MLLRQCYSLVSITRPVKTNLITRFISRSIRFGQCLPRNIDECQSNISASNISSDTRTDDESDTLKSRDINGNVNATPPVARIQEIMVDLPDRQSFPDDSDITLPDPLEKCTEDLSDIGPYLTPTFTFAKYANKSVTIQKLVKLGVSLYKFESDQDLVKLILGLDFERDIEPYIRFLHDCGVPADNLGKFLTKNPYILKEDMDDLRTRIRYLRAHDFTPQMISIIICKNPKWLLYTTKVIDGRLGYFQNNFKLDGHQIRLLAVKGPTVITYKMVHLLNNTMTIKEDMCFDQRQAKKLLLTLPKLWTKNRERLFKTFEYAHNEMQLQRDFITQVPHILLCRTNRLQQRHMFLVEMKKAQYDPMKPLYVSPKDLVSGTDMDFCRNIAKTSIETYNDFQKLF